MEPIGENLHSFAKRILPLRVIRERSDFMAAAEQESRDIFARVAERSGDDDRLGRLVHSPPRLDVAVNSKLLRLMGLVGLARDP